jgi:hypothetical protein
LTLPLDASMQMHVIRDGNARGTHLHALTRRNRGENENAKQFRRSFAKYHDGSLRDRSEFIIQDFDMISWAPSIVDPGRPCLPAPALHFSDLRTNRLTGSGAIRDWRSSCAIACAHVSMRRDQFRRYFEYYGGVNIVPQVGYRERRNPPRSALRRMANAERLGVTRVVACTVRRADRIYVS